MATNELPEHVAVNREHWDEQAPEWVAMGERAWAQPEPTWGQWGVADADCPMLPADCTGIDVVDLGCGTGYVSGWAARRGARHVLAIDNSEQQLATARRLAVEHGAEDVIEFVHGNAERVPAPDAAFDLAISEYGASIWCEPRAWLSEAKRLLRPGGACVFLGNHPLTMCTSPLDGSLPVGTELVRDWHGQRRFDWRDAVDEPGGIEFSLGTGEWVALFRELGFEVEDYREPIPSSDDDREPFAVTAAWARRWPSEHVWWLRLPATPDP